MSARLSSKTNAFVFARAEKYRLVKARGFSLARYVSSRAFVARDVPIGDNGFILENNTIQPFARIGNDVTLWSGNHIGHHAVIGDHVFVSSQVVISGGVKVGANCFLGVNATVSNGIELAPGTVLGAGAMILKNTVPDVVYPGAGSKLRLTKGSKLQFFTPRKARPKP